MSRVLETLLRELDTLDAEARTLAERHPSDALSVQPSQGSWSVAECWSHVAKTVESYMPKIDQAIAHGRAAGLTGAGPFHYGLLGRFFLWVVGPPARVKARAPSTFIPESGLDPQAALSAYLWQHEALRERIRAADGLDFAKIKLSSPASDKLTIALGIAFGAMIAHARRHHSQAEQILNRIRT